MLAAILAGLAAGIVMGVIQHVRLTPLIVQAEQYEHAEPAAAPTAAGDATDTVAPAAPAAPAAHDHSTAGHDTTGAGEHVHDPNAWAPQDGLERTFYTTLTAMLTAAGFALLLTGIAFLADIPVTRSNGLLWGLCGFIAVSLAPAIGLPPELPGMPAAGVIARQGWWIGTILCTAGAIWLIAAHSHRLRYLAAAAAAALPHVIGAPQPPDLETAVPANLAAQFVTSSLAANLVMWLLIGLFLSITLSTQEDQAKA